MTPEHLARIAAAIDADAATEASNWPLARDRTRAYLALARAHIAERRAFEACRQAEPGAPYRAAWDAWAATGDGIRAALAALAPAETEERA